MQLAQAQKSLHFHTVSTALSLLAQTLLDKDSGQILYL